MTTGMRRLRGFLLRLAFERRRAIPAGVFLIAAAVILTQSEVASTLWWSDGIALVFGATGFALIVASLGGKRPDWSE